MLSESSCFQCVLLFKIAFSIKHLCYIIPLFPLLPVCLTRCNMVYEASYSCCDVVIWWLKDVGVLHLYSSTFPALYWFWPSRLLCYYSRHDERKCLDLTSALFPDVCAERLLSLVWTSNIFVVKIQNILYVENNPRIT